MNEMSISRGFANAGVSVGMSYAPAVRRIIANDPCLLDHVEFPFELLEANPSLFDTVGRLPKILHCASLSIGGSSPPCRADLERVSYWVERTATPWVGEHLAYIRVDDGPGEAVDVGFTVPPPMNAESVQTACRNSRAASEFLGVPLLLENSPIYFEMPGSDRTQVDYLNDVMLGCDSGLLLDLTHLYISATNCRFRAEDAVKLLPLERVREIHVSGVEEFDSILWDNHSSPIPAKVLELLAFVVPRSSVEAVTLEYNWISDFPDEKMVEQVGVVRKLIENCLGC